jgi:hypothetical protein
MFVKLLKETDFPAPVLAGKANIKKHIIVFPVTVDFMLKPARLLRYITA